MAVSVSVALLIVPLVGFVLLLVLPVSATSEEPVPTGEVVEVITTSTAKPRSAPTPRVPATSRLPPPPPPPSSTDVSACCRELRILALSKDTHLQQVYGEAVKACSEAIRSDDPTPSLEKLRSFVLSGKAELPEECE